MYFTTHLDYSAQTSFLLGFRVEGSRNSTPSTMILNASPSGKQRTPTLWPESFATQTPGRIQKVDPLMGVPIKYP